MSLPDALLNVRDLNISFNSPNNPVPVVSGLSFNVMGSEIFGLAGESGCGKSLTALSIMGILPSNAHASGEIIFRDRDLLRMDEEQKRRLRGNEIAMIFQEPMTSLNPVLTIGYQIAEVLVTHQGMSKKDAEDRAVELLAAVRIPSAGHRLKEYPHQMSGGMRQRVMIAMSIACNPRLLIADEPTTALDVTIQAQILELLQGLREERGMSLLLITHDLGILAENASRIGIMYAGRLVETGDTAEIFTQPCHPYTIGLLGSVPRGKGLPLRPIPGIVPRPEELPPGCKYSNRCGYSVAECNTAEPALTQITGDHFARCIRIGDIRAGR